MIRDCNLGIFGNPFLLFSGCLVKFMHQFCCTPALSSNKTSHCLSGFCRSIVQSYPSMLYVYFLDLSPTLQYLSEPTVQSSDPKTMSLETPSAKTAAQKPMALNPTPFGLMSENYTYIGPQCLYTVPTLGYLEP